MKFTKMAATGKAGEQALSIFVEEQLGHLYHLTATDIGIDGEIEILNRRETTGGLVKVQVKASTHPVITPEIRIPLREDHLDYFASLTVPVILVYACRADSRFWWTPIIDKERHRGPRGGFAVTLNVERDRLTRASGPLLALIGNYSNATIAKSLIASVEEDLDGIDRARETEDYDFDHWAHMVVQMESELAEATCLLKYERRYTNLIAAIVARHGDAEIRLRDFEEWIRHVGYGDVLDERLLRERPGS